MKYPDSKDVITRAQTEIICDLLHLLPWNDVVTIHKFFLFVNTDSYLLDGIFIDSVRLVNDGHYVEVTFRRIDYEKFDKTGRSVDSLGEDDDRFFEPSLSTCILKSNHTDRNLLPLLDLVYAEAKNKLT